MAEIITRCPQCKMTFQISDEWLGKDVTCPQCGSIFVVREEKSASGVKSAKSDDRQKETANTSDNQKMKDSSTPQTKVSLLTVLILIGIVILNVQLFLLSSNNKQETEKTDKKIERVCTQIKNQIKESARRNVITNCKVVEFDCGTPYSSSSAIRDALKEGYEPVCFLSINGTHAGEVLFVKYSPAETGSFF